MADYTKLSLEELEARIQKNTAKRHEIQEDSRELHKAYDQKVAEAKLSKLSDDELSSLAQVLKTRGIEAPE